MEDSRIVELYWQRSEDAITETDAKYGSFCYGVSFGILRSASDAEESVNDTYLAAWNAMPPHRPDVLKAFLGKLTRRISIDRWRRGKAEKRGGGRTGLVLEELSWCIPDGGSIDERIELEELTAAVNAFLRGLSEEQRSIFVCRYWYCDSVQEIAQRFGFSAGKVMSVLFRLREKLSLHLAKEGFTVGR